MEGNLDINVLGSIKQSDAVTEEGHRFRLTLISESIDFSEEINEEEGTLVCTHALLGFEKPILLVVNHKTESISLYYFDKDTYKINAVEEQEVINGATKVIIDIINDAGNKEEEELLN